MLNPDFSSRPMDTARAFPFAALQDVNHRCIELLVHAARISITPPFSLIAHLREPLRRSTPESRRAAASRGVLLVDMQFDQPAWWRRVLSEPERAFRSGPGCGAFPRQSGIALARATLALAWNAVQTDRTVAGVLLGMDAEVATLISSLPLTRIDRFATRHFRRVRPRWADRTDFWGELLRLCESDPNASTHELDLKALRILLGDTLRAARRAGDRGSLPTRYLPSHY